MKPSDLACIALLAASAAVTPPAAPAAIPVALGGGATLPSLAPMIRRVSPTVVNITTCEAADGAHAPLRNDPFHDRFFHSPAGQDAEAQPFASAGSGVIVDARHGYILTNAHVVAHASAITVTLQDGRSREAERVGIDPLTDLAIVRIAAHGLRQIRLGDSARLAVGDFVVAIGNPFGLPHSVTSGIVSGLKRSGLTPDDYERYIQTDASINPGNSGGALVDLRGDLVGINTAILSESGNNIGIGFAIPIDTAKIVMRQLIAYGAVVRGQIGVSLYAVTPEVAHTLGLHRAAGGLVAAVIAGSPAEKAGIQAGDVILAVAGHRVDSNTDLRRAIGLFRVGEAVNIDLRHDGRLERRRAVLVDTMADTMADTMTGPLAGTLAAPHPPH